MLTHNVKHHRLANRNYGIAIAVILYQQTAVTLTLFSLHICRGYNTSIKSVVSYWDKDTHLIHAGEC